MSTTISTTNPRNLNTLGLRGKAPRKAESGDSFSRAEISSDPTVAFKQAKALLQEATARLCEDVKVERKDFRVEPGSKFRMKDCDPKDDAGLPGDNDVLKALTERELKKIDKLQEKLYAEHKQSVLIVFQAMDTGGKDGTISNLTNGTNPQGVKVACFKKPTDEETDHDPLWRVHDKLPGKGEIGIFNRSHYEDVLVTRVHGMIDDDQAEKRMENIRNFEKMLTDEGTTVIKFFLNIDKDEQKARLKERQADPAKNWKLTPADIKEREYWDDYQRVYQDAIGETSTKKAPWYVVPANDKKRRDLIVATIVRKHLEDLDIQTPKASFDVSQLDIR